MDNRGPSSQATMVRGYGQLLRCLLVPVVPAPVAAAQTGAVSAYVEDVGDGSFFCMSVAERSPVGEGLKGSKGDNTEVSLQGHM
jgi:hypothetical protein